MKLGVVSDTHLPRFGRRLPRALVAGLVTEHVELILHLGDFTSPEVPALFESIAPLKAVAGNNDGPEIEARFGRRGVVEAGGLRIGLVHGDLGRGRRSVDRALDCFADEVDTLAGVFFGHSHQPLVERRGRLLLVNPGSPTDKRREPAYSYAIAEVMNGEIEARIVRFDDRRVE